MLLRENVLLTFEKEERSLMYQKRTTLSPEPFLQIRSNRALLLFHVGCLQILLRPESEGYTEQEISYSLFTHRTYS